MATIWKYHDIAPKVDGLEVNGEMVATYDDKGMCTWLNPQWEAINGTLRRKENGELDSRSN